MSETPNQTMHAIATAIEKHQRFLIATHVRPDGDAIGSLLALAFMLRQLRKTVVPFCQDPPPPGAEFLPGTGDIHHDLPRPADYEVAILVDCGEFQRVGAKLAESIRQIPYLINIDHHLNGAPFGDLFWVTPSASSTCEMLYELALILPVRVDSDIASQLYIGLLTDTGSFRFSNTNRRVLEIAAKLVAAGAQPAAIARQVYDSTSPQRLRLLAKVLSSVTFAAENRLATARVTQAMFAETGSSATDSDGFIDHLRSVKSVEMAMLFREDNHGQVHVSLRSKGEVDVARFAKRYQGGGHRQAAAFNMPGTAEGICPQLAAAAERYLVNSHE